jgi:hypothetical protein
MLHEMAQPAAAASLAVDVALHELQQGQVEAAQVRLAVAADQLATLRDQLRRHARAGPVAVADPSAMLLRHALRDLMQAPGPAMLRCRVEPAGGATGGATGGAASLRIHLAGGAAPDAAARPWLDLLRAAGVQLACRPARAEPDGHAPTRRVWIDISLPPALG